MSHAATGTSDRELTLTRTFDAPRELVYDAWTRPGDPNVFRVTVTFTDRGGRTEVTMLSRFASAAALEAAKRYGGTLDQLGALLSGGAPR